jgi:hypothetical protein
VTGDMIVTFGYHETFLTQKVHLVLKPVSIILLSHIPNICEKAL